MTHPTDSEGRQIGRDTSRDARFFGDYELDIARRVIAGTFPFEGIGEGNALNGDNKDVWLGPTDSQPEPVIGGYQPNLISSSVEDAVGGSGVPFVVVVYLNKDGDIKAEVVTLTGQVAVNMVATDVMFVNFFMSTSPSGNVVAAGNIDLRNSTEVMNRIVTATNFELSTMKQVPRGKALFLQSWHAEGVATTVKVARLRLRTTFDPVFRRNAPGLYRFLDPASVKDSGTGQLPFEIPKFVGPLATVKVSAWTTGAIDVSASWRGFVEDFPR